MSGFTGGTGSADGGRSDFNVAFGTDLGLPGSPQPPSLGGLAFPGKPLGLTLPLGFLDSLQPASWRGQRFVVLGSTVRAGRRKAVHEYPFRDGPWVEDLGKRGRIYGFSGFLVGDDVGQQVQDLTARAEQAGPGELVHPTFGSRQVECVDFEAGDAWDAGRVWQIKLEFLEPRAPGLQLLPAASDSTQDQVGDSADDADAASSGSFLDGAAAAVAGGIGTAQAAAAAVAPFVATAARLAGDASGLLGSVRGIAGRFGRFAGGSGLPVAGAAPLRTAQDVQAAVGLAIGAATVARRTVQDGGTALALLAQP